MGRLYYSHLYFGLRFKINAPWSEVEEHAIVKRARDAGLDWSHRDMSLFFDYQENDQELFVGKRLSESGLDLAELFSSFSEEELAAGVAEARAKLKAAGFDEEPCFHHMSEHSD